MTPAATSRPFALASTLIGPIDGPLILWLHGFLGDRRDWRGLIATMPEARHLLVDLPGHGDSPPPPAAGEPSSASAFDSVATALLALVEGALAESASRQVAATGSSSPAATSAPAPTLGPGASVVAYSLGSRVAMALLPRLYDRCLLGRVVLMSGHPGLLDPAARRARLSADVERAARLREHGLAAFVDAWYALPMLASLHRTPEAAAILRRRREGDAAALAAALLAFSTGHQPNRLPQLRPFADRICWLAGAEDAAYVALLRRARDASPGSRLHVVADAGHQIHLDQPAICARLLRAWLLSDSASDGPART